MNDDAMVGTKCAWPRQRDVAAAGSGRRWYLVECSWRSDAGVLKWLEQMRVEHYYPRMSEMRRKAQRHLTKAQRRSGIPVYEPKAAGLFPRYVFVRFDRDKDRWRDFFKIAGVVGLVCEGGQPAPVSDELIAAVRAQEVDGVVPGSTPMRVVLGLGDEVQIADGPFRSFTAVVERGVDVAAQDFDPEARIRVAVRLFGQSTSVELMVGQVDRL